MKNKLIILLLIILSFPCNAFDIESSWIDETSYKYITTRSSDLNYSECITNSLLIKPDINYVYLPDFARSFEIKNIDLEKNGTYLLELTFHYSKDLIGFDYDWNIQMKIIPIDEQRCHIILSGDDTENHTLYGLESVWYRTYSPSRIPIKNATINDSRVRLRVKPNLNCETWAFLDKGLSVKIKDKSSEPMEIDGESWYWYKVESENLPDGWVYGKYLDVKESNYENSKLAVNEKISKFEKLKTLYSQSNQIKRNSQNSKIEDNETFSDPKKKKYSYFGNTFDEKERILTITNNKILLPFNLTIGQTESDIRENFGEPDTINKNTWLFLEGTKFKYTAIFYLNDGILTKIEVKYEY